MKLRHARKTCAECPWRRDARVGKFPPERFQALATTAEDMAERVFACHMSDTEHPHTCAGFILRQGEHNLTVRLARRSGSLDVAAIDPVGPLFPTYREMAVANGVDPNDPCLANVRDDGQV